MELGYARVSTTHQDLDRQIDALTKHGIPTDRLYVDKKTGATVDRDGLRTVLDYARAGDTITACTLDRFGRNLRECLNLVHDLRERGIGLRTLHDPLPIDTSNDSPMAQIAVAMLALFAEMERVFGRERAAHARSVAEAKGKPAGRPRKLTGDTADAVAAAVAAGMAPDVAAQVHHVSRATVYRFLADTRAAQQQPDQQPEIQGAQE